MSAPRLLLVICKGNLSLSAGTGARLSLVARHRPPVLIEVTALAGCSHVQGLHTLSQGSLASLSSAF